MNARMGCPIAWCVGDTTTHGGDGALPEAWTHHDDGVELVHGAALYRSMGWGDDVIRYELVMAGKTVGAGTDLNRLGIMLRDIAGAVEALRS